MTIRPFQDAQLPELMGWFHDHESCQVWGGPEFRFPYSEASFRIDAKLASLPTWVLVEADGRLAGFGQCYFRVGRCHVGRLAVSPARRGQGLGSTLLRELCSWGRAHFSATECSLFVAPSNGRARRLYERLGFAAAPYPEPSPEVAPYVYMVAREIL